MQYVAIAITVLCGLGIITAGVQYLVAPAKTAKSFGLPAWPDGRSLAWLNLKGVRDIVSGLVALIPLALGQYQVLAYLLLAAALTPIGDALTILRYRGNKTLAYAMHGSTAIIILIASVLFFVS
ncbi:DUF4267 domain-containing protein [Actinocrispum sp. NPDC049592]|uniref:DUF4267 domain-containing protein n=1 Tax=Actinocrispum sp. NPDC049592 TaxID=3154835 RepID=UPI00341A650E